MKAERVTERTGGTGVFVSVLRENLLRGEVDFAVHSLRDLPTGTPAGITLTAIPADTHSDGLDTAATGATMVCVNTVNTVKGMGRTRCVSGVTWRHGCRRLARRT